MRAGQLNKIINIEAPTKASDGMGGFVDGWKVVASNIHAAIWPVSAKEMIRADSTTMVASHNIRIRYRSVMRSSWRISWAGKYFNIVGSVDPNSDRRWLHLLCKATN